MSSKTKLAESPKSSTKPLTKKDEGSIEHAF